MNARSASTAVPTSTATAITTEARAAQAACLPG